MDNIIMENNQLKQVPAPISNAVHEDEQILNASNPTKRGSATDIDVSRLLIIMYFQNGKVFAKSIEFKLFQYLSCTNRFDGIDRLTTIYRRCHDYQAMVLKPIRSRTLKNHHTRRPPCRVGPAHKHLRKASWNANVKKVSLEICDWVSSPHTYLIVATNEMNEWKSTIASIAIYAYTCRLQNEYKGGRDRDVFTILSDVLRAQDDKQTH